MKHISRTIKPQYSGKAKLSDINGLELDVPCKLWLPRHVGENPYVHFEYYQDVVKGSINPGDLYKLKMELCGFGGKVEAEITVDKLYIDNYSIQHFSEGVFPIISFNNEPQIVVVKQFLSHVVEDIEITFKLGDNFLLDPFKMMEQSFTGEINIIGETKNHEFLLGKIGKLKFDRHYYYLEQQDGGNTQYSNLVAIVEPNASVEEKNESNISKIKDELSDYLLLASIASNQRTNICNYSAKIIKKVLDRFQLEFCDS